MKNLYLVSYKSNGKECPSYTGGKNYTDGKWEAGDEWNFEDPNPFKFEISSKYSLKITYSILDLDFSDSLYVSEVFLRLLDDLNVKYRAVPLEIILRAKKQPNKKYFYLLLEGRTFLLDKENSTFKIARDLYTQEVIYSEFYDKEPLYESIEKFHISSTETPHFFICAETKQLMCTQEFKQLAEERNILGIDFEKIENNFKYDPFANFPA